MKTTRRIDLHKHYQIPDKTTTVRYKGYILVVADNVANWIVLENDSQLEFYELLKSLPLDEALESFKGDFVDARKTVIQLEAKQFENTEVKRTKAGRMHIYLTNACNMRCPQCYMYAGDKAENELTTAELEQLLRLYARHGGKSVTFSGGEICMRKDLYELVLCGYHQGLSVQLLTNGILWTDVMIEKIAPLVSSVQISIDGFDEKTNAKIRGKGSFEKALDNLNKFIASGVHTELAITPFYDATLSKNYVKYVEFAKSLLEKYKDNGFKVIFSGELMDGRNLKLTSQQQDEYVSIMEKVNAMCYGETAIEDAFVSARKNREIKTNCTYGCLNVSAMGDVYYCSRVGSLKPFANIRTSDFSKILRLSENASEASEVEHLTPCKDCELKYICGGGCRIKYFKDFTHCTDFEHVDCLLLSRTCSIKDKEYFYDLMLRTNHRLYK